MTEILTLPPEFEAAWQKAVDRLVKAKLDDALAHARNAVTESLKRTPDGRATLRRASRSRSYQAAVNRLDELLDDLAGPAVTSLDGVLRNAREQAYRRAWPNWLPLIPAAWRVTAEPEPTAAGGRRVRGTPVHGYDLRTELKTPIERAKRTLLAAVNAAGSLGGSVDLLKTWRRNAGDSLGRAAAIALGDGIALAEQRAGRDIIHPDYLEST